jgi:hypothetical protein
LEKLFSHKPQNDEAEQELPLHETLTVPCARCHRSTHNSNNCHAKKDVDGNDIETPPTVSLVAINAKFKAEKEKVQKKIWRAKKMLKTKKIPCDTWKAGKCTRGDDCLFSHDDPDGFDPRSKQLCHFHKLGSCLKGNLCVFSHCKKDFPCVYFHKKSLSCKFTSESCEYHHNTLSNNDKLFLDHIEHNYASKKGINMEE